MNSCIFAASKKAINTIKTMIMNFMSTHPAFVFIFAVLFVSMIVSGYLKMQELNKQLHHDHDKQ